MAALHDSGPAEVPASLRRSALWERWTPDGLPRTAPIGKIVTAIERLRTVHWPEARFCHCDFHPANVLFSHGAVSGVVDWSSARLAPVLNDVGRVRMELSLWPGSDAPDRFTATYTTLTGRSLENVEYWDILAGAVALEHGFRWLPSFHDVGVDLTFDQLHQHATHFVQAALAKVDM